MSFEAIYNISQAEAEGKAAVAAALAKAEDELKELRVKAGEKEKADADKLLGELETKKAVLLAKAEAKLEKAASLVVERIVNN